VRRPGPQIRMRVRWTLGDTITFGIGQSALLTTPLNQAGVRRRARQRRIRHAAHLVHLVRDASGRVTQTQQREVV